MAPTTRERRDTVVIGGGQAGLAAGYHLAQAGRDFIILDDRPRPGDSWRCHWDSLKLYSPAELDGLPGMPFPAARHSFPAKDDMADYLESYAARFGLPVRHNSRVRRLRRLGSDYVVDCDGSSILAGNVVVATGSFGRTASTPDFAGRLGPQIRQLHSSEYRNPGQLRDGPVLVVGASHSGGDIAFEVASTHATILCGRDTGQIPLRLDGGPMRTLFPLVWFAWGHVLSLNTPIGRKAREHARHHGAPLLRVRSGDLAAAGVQRVTERVTGVRSGLPVLGERGPVQVANVIWCTGFRQDFGWIDLPVIDEDGWPLEVRGVVSAAPGLYFTGLCFQSSFRSMLIGGAGPDAEHVVRHLLARGRTDAPLVPAA
jgi:putative flavoprotein involved in K+ transport